MVGLNKFAILARSTSLILVLLICSQDSQAISSAHYSRHKAAQYIPPERKKAGRASRNKRYSSSLHKKHPSKASRNVAAKPRYAYPMGTFLMEPPTFEATPLPDEISTQIKKAFYSGNAGEFPTRSLVRAGIASYYPMRGGIFWRREQIKYLIMHSTEPGIPVGAKTIVDGWSHGGRRHAGAHYVIDRDGTIYQAVDPDLATVHINIFKTLPGINNDNSVGIEMCHQGSQDYPPALVESAARLAAYLQNHYHIADANIITHRYAQQGDHTDPVNFGWDNFIAQKNTLQNQGLNQRLALLKTQMFNWQPIVEQPTIIISDKKNPASTAKSRPAKPETAKAVEVQNKPASNPLIPPLVEVQAKPASKPMVPNIVEVQAKTAPSAEKGEIQSPFEAKFGSIDKPNLESPFEAKFVPANKSSLEETAHSSIRPSIELPQKSPPQTQAALSAPLPSSGSSINPAPIAPKNSADNTSRLIPRPTENRLVPVTMIINTQPNNSAISRPTPKYMPGEPIQHALNNPQVSQSNVEKKSSRLLPLRGPIEMEPDEASALSQ